MKIRLATLDYSVKKEDLQKFLKYGFKFRDDLNKDRKFYHISSDKTNIIELNTIEDLMELEKTFNTGLIVYSDVIYIYNDYFE